MRTSLRHFSSTGSVPGGFCSRRGLPVGSSVTRLARGLLLLGGALAGGCGNLGGAEPTAAMVSGMPKCDPSLLHPRISVGAAAGLPGKLIMYVDGVMACVDDAARVDQLVPQIEGRAPASAVLPVVPVTPAAVPGPVSAAGR